MIQLAKFLAQYYFSVAYYAWLSDAHKSLLRYPFPLPGGRLGWGCLKMYYQKLARELRKKSTEAERWLWQHLRLKQMSDFKFRRQHPLGKYVVDFICLEAKLIVEVDGGQHNMNGSIKKDIVRTQWLEQQGFKVLRFWNNDVLGNILSVKEAIWSALIDYPHPNLPPGRGKG